MDGQEFATSILYRLAYGIAADRVEASRFDTLYGWRHQAKGGAAEAIEAEVLARVGCLEPAARETIREAIADALAGRRSRWWSRGPCRVDRCQGPRDRHRTIGAHDRSART